MEESMAPYTLEIGRDAAFSEIACRAEGVPFNFYTHDTPLEPGEYYWRVNSDIAPKVFTVEGGVPVTPIPSRDCRYKNALNTHPRIWMNPAKIEAYRAKVKAGDANFDAFYKNSVLPRIEEGFPKEPPRYPNDIRVVKLWRKNYMDCQVALCYVRSLSVAGVILEDNGIIEKAKSALLELAGWDYSLETGSTTRLYNDECAYRVGYGLAYGYDWLYNHMDASQRETVLNSLYQRTKEVAEYAIIEKKIHNFPYDSHAIRSLSMMMIPCCIALLDFESNDPRHKDAQNWLDYAIEYISALYTPWGGADGGWAEGPLYWTTGMAFVTEALGLVRNYMDINLFERPFFRATGDYILHCNPSDTYRASFGDQSNIGQKPGPKTAFNMRIFAGNTGNGHYQWFFNRVMERAEMAPEHFSDKGWWDLYYDDIVYSTNYAPVTEIAPPSGTQVKHFRDIGWVAINKNMADFDNHIFLLMKSSPFGSLSHSHADQNTFVLYAFNQPLIFISGYYEGYSTKMHLNWRKQTKSANTILIDGIGQYSGLDYDGAYKARAENQDITAGEEKINQLAAKGKIVEVTTTPEHTLIVADATQAYALTVPYLKKYIREIYWREDNTIVIKDYVDLAQKGRVTSLLHTIAPFEIADNGNFALKVGSVALTGTVTSTSGVESITQTDKFIGVPEEEYEGLDCHHHLSVNTGLAESHEITTYLRISKE